MPLITDYFYDAVPTWTGQVGSGAVSDGTTQTIPIQTASGLTNGEVYVFTIDRVDANGVKTAAQLAKKEVCKGLLSGTNFINTVRGVEGTAQAHAAGAVIEILFTAKQWDDLITGIKIGHNADGTHATSLPLTTPKITTSINDANGNEVIKTPATTSAVNEVTVTNAATGSAPSLAATGGDTNIDLNLVSKGSGVIKFNGVAAPTTSGSSDGWTTDTNTWTYSSVDGATGLVTINADLTAIIQAGDRIKFTQTTVKYFIVTKTPTFAAGSTTLTFYGGTDYTLVNAAITLPSYSHQKSPFGFNADLTKWTAKTTNTTNNSQSSPTQSVWYNLGTISISIPIGVWTVNYKTQAGVTSGADQLLPVYTSLSTTNNSASDADFTAKAECSGSSQYACSMFVEKTLALTSKTTYYLNTMSDNSGISLIYNNGAQAKIVINAICAYL